MNFTIADFGQACIDEDFSIIEKFSSDYFYNTSNDGHVYHFLHRALEVLYGNPEAIKMLFRPQNKGGIGIDVNHRESGTTALISASAYGKIDIIKLLLEYGADVEIRTVEGGMNALEYSVYYGYIDIIKLLLEYGAEINEKTLDYAKNYQLDEEVKKLVNEFRNKRANIKGARR